MTGNDHDWPDRAVASSVGLRDDRDELACESLPTRRTMLTLLTASLLDSGHAASGLMSSAGTNEAPTFERRWADLVAAIAEQDRAMGRHNRLERLLLRHLESLGPAGADDGSVRGAVDDTDTGFVAVGEMVASLIRSLADRHADWEQAAALVGLYEAEDAQALARSGVQQAVADLIQEPALDLNHLRRKLVALIAVHEPGLGFRRATPWRELRLILADVETLLRSPCLSASTGSPGLNSRRQ